MRACALVLMLVLAPAAAQSPSFMEGVAAYDAGDAIGCADTLLAVEAAGGPVPRNGELLAVECLSQAGRYDDAFAYLRRQLPGGRIAFEDLRDKSRPGLDALRRQPGWTALLAEATAREITRIEAIDATLRDELLARAARDQQARSAAIGAPGTDVDPEHWRVVQALDRDNTEWLRGIVDARGWPGADLVGHDGANAAWLLAQHADHDPAFQALALERMAPAVEKGLVDGADFALLTDRVLLAQGKPQRYGSQFKTGADGRMRMRPVEDAAGLDARRQALGLPAIAEYRRMLEEAYGQPVD